MRGQLIQTTDGSLLCNFPERMILIANHQIYTDWLYLWWIGYTAGMHGRIYVVLKESLKRIPVVGWGMQFSQFIFLKRKWEQDKPRMAAHMQKFNKRSDPMWLMMFPEGTNLADSTREASQRWADTNGIKDMQHTLLPRSTGLRFVLQELRQTVDYVYDCTIAYEGVLRGQFAQDIFTVGASYFGGRPPKSVNMYWRRFRVSAIPLDDPKKFELWLRNRWIEKDKFIEDYLRTGNFPADDGVNKDHNGRTIRGAGHIETEIKPKYWYEFLQVFAPIGLFALVLYMFYGALPTEVLNKIKSVDQKTILKQMDAYQKGQIKVPSKKQLGVAAAKALQNQANGRGSKLKNAAVAHGIVTLNGVPQKDFPAPTLGRPTGVQVGKKRKVATKPKALAKPIHNKKVVTMNGIPLKDFPAKGLSQSPGKHKTTAESSPMASPKGSNPGDPSGERAASQTPSTTEVGIRRPQTQNRAQMKDAKLKKAATSKATETEAKQPVRVAPKKTNLKPKPNPAPRKIGPKQPAVRKATKGAPGVSATKPSGSSAPRTASKAVKATTASEASEGQNVDSAEVRRARKRLEPGQGKQEPKRETCRTVVKGNREVG